MKLLLLITLAALNILPAPKQSEIREGSYTFPKDKKEYSLCVCGDVNRQELADFQEYLKLNGYTQVKKKAGLAFYVGKNRFKGTLPYAATVDEGYRLDVTKGGISVNAAAMAGAFYAFQTIRQLDNGGTFQCCRIIDEPAMAHRGLMFDVVRHFRSVDFVCRQLDAMASMKMNRLHFHLTDDQAWRLQLDSHPEMIKTAFRTNIRHGKTGVYNNGYAAEPPAYVPGTVNFEDGCYGGYYSKENIRRILEYARIRHIEVIPEIEMPGHSTEVLNMHPELRCNCEQKTKRVVCPGKEETFIFFQEVLDEVMKLFPSKYIHVGGDEASKMNWEICPDCARRMQQEGLTSVEQLQSYLIGRMEKYINSKGKKMVGWDEIMQGGLCDNATVMSWRGTEYGYKAIEQGHDVIFSPTTYFYLDYYQGHPAIEPLAIGHHKPLSVTWSAPIYAGKHIIGVQGNLWCEYVTSDKHFEYMLYPRALAIAEIGWSPGEKRNDFGEFCTRAKSFADNLKACGYAVHDFTADSIMDEDYAPVKHLALGAKVDFRGEKYNEKPHFYTILTDGEVGNGDVSLTWARVKGHGEFTVDLAKAQDIHYAGVTCLHYRHSYFPAYVEVYVSSDGKDFRRVGQKISRAFGSPSVKSASTVDFDPSTYKPAYEKDGSQEWSTATYSFVCNEKGIRYIRFVLEPREGFGTMAVDELVIN